MYEAIDIARVDDVEGMMTPSESVETKPSWRERVRNSAIQEIRRTARELLAKEGTDGLTVRAVAREMGISSPAIYRYFSSHNELVDAVIVDVFDELVSHLQDAINAIDAVTPKQIARRITTGSRTLRAWAIEHPHEFSLTMVTPINEETKNPEVQAARWRFGRVFGALFVQLWDVRRFPVPPREALSDDLVTASEEFREQSGLPTNLPVAAVAVMLRSWVRLYSVVCMESMGQIRFLGDDRGALFEAELSELDRMIEPQPVVTRS